MFQDRNGLLILDSPGSPVQVQVLNTQRAQKGDLKVRKYPESACDDSSWVTVKSENDIS